MTRGAPLGAMLAHEGRALLPVWAACVLAAIAASALDGGLRELGLVVFAATALGLGAQAIGHEYSNATLGLTLTLPVSRQVLLLAKAAVLAAMLLPLAVYAWWSGLAVMASLPWLAAAAAFGLAPLLTMVMRSGLAGLIGAVTVPPLLMIAMQLASGRFGDRDGDLAVLPAWTRVMVFVVAAGAVLGWRRFLRLEAIDGSVADWHVRLKPDATGVGAEAAPGRPLWQLLKKELRLQQLTFALAAWYVVTAWPGAALLRASGIEEPAVGIGASIYWLAVPVLAGSVAIAGERQVGTLAWQLALPMPVWRQFAAKVAAVFGVSLMLGLGVPALLAAANVPGQPQPTAVSIFPVALLASISLYVSSLHKNGLSAAVASLAVAPLMTWFLYVLAEWLWRAPVEIGFWRGAEYAWLAWLAIFVAALLALAFANHRVDAPPAARIGVQSLMLTGLLGSGVLIGAARF